MSVINITKENFQSEVVESSKPVLIDFWAPWCGPCRMLAPVMDEIATEVSDWKICKINVDSEGDLASQFGIESIPTLIIMKNGEIERTFVGARPKEDILNIIKS